MIVGRLCKTSSNGYFPVPSLSSEAGSARFLAGGLWQQRRLDTFLLERRQMRTYVQNKDHRVSRCVRVFVEGCK